MLSNSQRNTGRREIVTLLVQMIMTHLGFTRYASWFCPLLLLSWGASCGSPITGNSNHDFCDNEIASAWPRVDEGDSILPTCGLWTWDGEWSTFSAHTLSLQLEKLESLTLDELTEWMEMVRKISELENGLAVEGSKSTKTHTLHTPSLMSIKALFVSLHMYSAIHEGVKEFTVFPGSVEGVWLFVQAPMASVFGVPVVFEQSKPYSMNAGVQEEFSELPWSWRRLSVYFHPFLDDLSEMKSSIALAHKSISVGSTPAGVEDLLLTFDYFSSNMLRGMEIERFENQRESTYGSDQGLVPMQMKAKRDIEESLCLLHLQSLRIAGEGAEYEFVKNSILLGPLEYFSALREVGF